MVYIMSRRGSPLNRAEIDQRRTLVAQLYLQKNTQMEIAKILNVDQSTVSLDIKAIRKSWQEAAASAFEVKVAQLNAEIEEIKRQAAADNAAKRDYHYLDTQLKGVIEQAKLFGLYAPTKQELSTNANLPMQIELVYAVKPKQLAASGSEDEDDGDENEPD